MQTNLFVHNFTSTSKHITREYKIKIVYHDRNGHNTKKKNYWNIFNWIECLSNKNAKRLCNYIELCTRISVEKNRKCEIAVQYKTRIYKKKLTLLSVGYKSWIRFYWKFQRFCVYFHLQLTLVCICMINEWSNNIILYLKLIRLDALYKIGVKSG